MSTARPHGWLRDFEASMAAWVVCDGSYGDVIVLGMGATPFHASVEAPDVNRAPARATAALAALVAAGQPAARVEDGIAYAPGEQTIAEWFLQVIDAQPLPDAAAPWADERRNMVKAMALAAANGNPAVVLAADDGVAWSRDAACRTGVPTSQPTAPLAKSRADAAKEMSENLGLRQWVRRPETEADKTRR